MYAVDPSGKKIDTQLLMFTHLSQLLTCITGVGGLIVPLFIWLTQKDKIADMDLHGKSIVNFQLSLIVWAISDGRESARAVDTWLMGESRLPTKGGSDLPRL